MTRYRTTIEVQAWQYPGGGVIPEEARDLFERRGTKVQHNTYPYHMADYMREIVAFHNVWEPPVEGTPMDSLGWYDPQLSDSFECFAGDWIVSTEYGVEAVRDAYFREAYEPIEQEAA